MAYKFTPYIPAARIRLLSINYLNKKAVVITALIVILAAGLFIGPSLARLGWQLTYWKAYIWAPAYWNRRTNDPAIADNQKHLIFILTDHYEHGIGESAAKRNEEWCRRFRVISDQNRDDFGNRFRYTWFYPYDHHNDAIMVELSRMAYLGYGETEMHWHIPPAPTFNSTNWGAELETAISWYQQFGAMISSGDEPQTHFAYIAGNWDLDAGRRAGRTHGITNQIAELYQHGCYADFTFPAVGSLAQPSTINSIYYVEDDCSSPKSYDVGIEARVGMTIDNELMIFEGPCGINWGEHLLYGALESDPRFTPDRVDRWIDANIHVAGRPEWVFVKISSHGAI